MCVSKRQKKGEITTKKTMEIIMPGKGENSWRFLMKEKKKKSHVLKNMCS